LNLVKPTYSLNFPRRLRAKFMPGRHCTVGHKGTRPAPPKQNLAVLVAAEREVLKEL